MSRAGSPSARALVVVLATCASLATGCDSAKKHEAAGVLAAIEAYRAAENPAKGAKAKALAAVACADPEICAVKKACVEVAEPTARALELKTEVEKGLARVQSGELSRESPEAKALPDKLDEAEHLLKQGRASLETCDEKALRLRGTYGI